MPVELFQILKDDAVKVWPFNMPVNLENSAVATGLEKFSIHPNPKERQFQIIFKLPHNCTHLTRWKSSAENSPSQASTKHEPRTSRCSSWFLEKAEEPETKLPTSAGSSKKQESSTKTSTFALLTTPKPLCRSQQTVENS